MPGAGELDGPGQRRAGVADGLDVDAGDHPMRPAFQCRRQSSS